MSCAVAPNRVDDYVNVLVQVEGAGNKAQYAAMVIKKCAGSFRGACSQHTDAMTCIIVRARLCSEQRHRFHTRKLAKHCARLF